MRNNIIQNRQGGQSQAPTKIQVVFTRTTPPTAGGVFHRDSVNFNAKAGCLFFGFGFYIKRRLLFDKIADAPVDKMFVSEYKQGVALYTGYAVNGRVVMNLNFLSQNGKSHFVLKNKFVGALVLLLVNPIPMFFQKSVNLTRGTEKRDV